MEGNTNRKKVHLSVMGGNPKEHVDPENKGGITRMGEIFTSIRSELIKGKREGEQDVSVKHLSMLPDFGTYGTYGPDGFVPETPGQTRENESKAGYDPEFLSKHKDEHRLNTSEADYSQWENKFNDFIEHHLRPHADEGIDLTLDTWSLGTSFILKYLNQPGNLQKLKDLNINIEGIHFIAPAGAIKTTFEKDADMSVAMDLFRSLQEKHGDEYKERFIITANKHDNILLTEGPVDTRQSGEDAAAAFHKIVNGGLHVEEHNTFNPELKNDKNESVFDLDGHLASHFVTDDEKVIGAAQKRTTRMIELNKGK